MKRVAVIVAGTLGAAAFAFPSMGFAHTHSAAGLAAECKALNAEYNKFESMEPGTANTSAIVEGLEAKVIAKYNGLGCSPSLLPT
jgi:hypothetical protein